MSTKSTAPSTTSTATGAWENLGKDKEAANRKARVFNDPEGLYGTIVYWMDRFLIECEARVKAGSAGPAHR